MQIAEGMTPPVAPSTAGKYLVALGVTMRPGEFAQNVSMCVCVPVCLCGCCMRTNLLVMRLAYRLVALYEMCIYVCASVHVCLTVCVCVFV